MKPWIHAKSSAKRYGGKPEDYLPIHNFMDDTKKCHPDVRHRALLHNSFGCFVVEAAFGTVATNSDGREYSPRDVAEDHCIEDLGKIPTVSDYLDLMEKAPWMGGPVLRRKMEISLEPDTKALKRKEGLID